MKKAIEKQLCESTTGCAQKGSLVYYNDKEEKLTLEQAAATFHSGDLIEVPSAGELNPERHLFEKIHFTGRS